MGIITKSMTISSLAIYSFSDLPFTKWPTLTLKNFIPINRDVMLCVVTDDCSLARSSFSSAMNRLLTDWKRDCARTPMTSAYKSAMVLMLAPLGLFWTLQEMENYITHKQKKNLLLNVKSKLQYSIITCNWGKSLLHLKMQREIQCLTLPYTWSA